MGVLFSGTILSLNFVLSSLIPGFPPSSHLHNPSRNAYSPGPPPPQAAAGMDFPLCKRCRKLDLRVEKFRVRGSGVQREGRPSTRSLRQSNERFPLGTLLDVKRSSSRCRLCYLVYSTVQRPDELPEALWTRATCHLVWEIDGRSSADAGSQGRNHSRRLRVCWSDEALKKYESYLILAAPRRYDDSDVGYQDLLNNETQFLGRHLGSWESKTVLIREFLRLCERHHDTCKEKADLDHDFLETLDEPYFGVIDIESKCLVPLPVIDLGNRRMFETYSTVSYVWGRNDNRQYMTKIANIQHRRKTGGLASIITKLPKALQQSIQLVHLLGIRYIWIDALCIVQDSSHSWNLNSRAMHLIYGNSYITVCAADGEDASAGLVALDESDKNDQLIRHCAPGVHLILHRPPEIIIEGSQWNKRGWTFQERLLSKRSIIFSDGRLYFHCRSTCMSEDVFADRKGGGWSLDLVRSPLQRLAELEHRALWFYVHSVSLYTLRDLYEPFDILAAFSGLCKHIEYTMRAPFVFGLPTSHLDFALLWQPLGPSKVLTHPTRLDEPKYKGMRFPSWSWCGWKSSSGVDHIPDMVQGPLQDVRGWLLRHTWVDWHIRDGHGTLRRVWDRDLNDEDKSKDAKWKGYETSDGTRVLNIYKARLMPQQLVIHRRREKSSPPSSYRSLGGRPRGRRRSSSPSSSDEPIEQLRRKTRAIQTENVRYGTNAVQGDGRGGRRGRSRSTSSSSSMRTRVPRKSHITRERTNVVKNRRRNTSTRSSSPSSGSSDILDRDAFGRYLENSAKANCAGKTQRDFKLTLPEDPYNVRTTKRSEDGLTRREFPDQPFLQFFTWKTSFYVVPTASAAATDPANSQPGGSVATGLHRCHIMDKQGDKCGSIVVDSEWWESTTRTKQTRCQNCRARLESDGVEASGDRGVNWLCSRCQANGRNGTNHAGTEADADVDEEAASEDPDTDLAAEFEFIAISEAKSFTEHEFPDWTYYIPKERIESEWDLYYVLLIEPTAIDGIHRRVALGKVFKTAFARSDDEWEEIILG